MSRVHTTIEIRRPVEAVFECTFVYAMPTRWLAWMDRLFIRRLMAAESARALHRLKDVLESA